MKGIIDVQNIILSLLLIVVAMCLINDNKFLIFTACVSIFFSIMYIVLAANEYFEFFVFCD